MTVLETKTKNAKTTTKQGKQNGGERKIGLFQRNKREREKEKETGFDLFFFFGFNYGVSIYS